MSAISKLIYMLKRHPAMQTTMYKELVADAEAELTSAINYFNKSGYKLGHSDIVQICEELLGKREWSFLKLDKDGKNWMDSEYNDGFFYDDEK